MTRMSPAEQEELKAAIDEEFALAAEPTGYRLGEAARVRDLTVNQRLAATALGISCRRCGIPVSENPSHWCNDGVTELWLGWAS